MILNTKYTSIQWKNDYLFKIFSSKITYGNKLFRKKSIGDKIDELYTKVRELLSIPSVTRFKIELSDREHMLLPKGYYMYCSREIFISYKDANNKILAHEMAHAVLDDCIGKRAPGRIGEIVAAYIARNI